ncbi:MAG: hypothetical protein ACRC28_18945 [Clostridium sp.]|uniref:hypothetical protein n=1 Tax=Clostridium sp. TaxID=1506 RepID=UPI003F373331
MDLRKQILEFKMEVCKNCFEVENRNEDIGITLKQQSFKEFIKINNITNVFYKFSFLDKEEFKINEEILEEQDINKKRLKKLKEQIERYNQELDKYDFSIPVELEIWTYYSQQCIGIKYEDLWIDTSLATMNVDEMLDNYNDVLEELQEKAEERKEEELLGLREYILEDSEFKISTNISLRQDYTIRLIQSKIIKKYKHLFVDEQNEFSKHKVLTYVERLWREYKMGY